MANHTYRILRKWVDIGPMTDLSPPPRRAQLRLQFPVPLLEMVGLIGLMLLAGLMI